MRSPAAVALPPEAGGNLDMRPADSLSTSLTHYNTAIVPARPYRARDKAKVEVAVQVATRFIIAKPLIPARTKS